MRWVQHWCIGRDIKGHNASLVFKLGTILPDWFEISTPHKIETTFDMVLHRIMQVSKMTRGYKRDFLLGTIVHYIADYCCYAHLEGNYLDCIHHRQYETKSQRLYLKQNKYNYILSMNNMYHEYTKHTDLYTVEDFIRYYKDKLIRRKRVNDIAWFNNVDVMKEDTFLAYNMLYGVLLLLGEFSVTNSEVFA